jgi:hypothetical protein
VIDLKKSLKIAAIAAVLFLALGVVVLVYASSQNAKSMDNERIGSSTDFALPDEMQKHMQQWINTGLGWLKRFVANATATQISGTVVSEFKGMQILNTDKGQVRVLLPRSWTLNNEVIGRGKLFNDTFSGTGQTVTVKVLESVLLEKDTFSINVVLGYEIINAAGTHAYAVLPFNIEPHS